METLAVVSVMAFALLGAILAADTFVLCVSAWVISVPSLPITAWASTVSARRLLLSATDTVA